MSIPLNDTGRYRKGRAAEAADSKKTSERCDQASKVKSHGLYELKSGMFAKSTQVTMTPSL